MGGHFGQGGDARAVNAVVVCNKYSHGIIIYIIMPITIHQMKLAQLLHNPGAGEEAHSKKELIALIEETLDVECRYFSTKEKDWQDIEPGIDLLVIAGGDGTIRKVCRELLNRKRIDRQVP